MCGCTHRDNTPHINTHTHTGRHISKEYNVQQSLMCRLHRATMGTPLF